MFRTFQSRLAFLTVALLAVLLASLTRFFFYTVPAQAQLNVELGIAIRRGRLELIRKLLAEGANPNAHCLENSYNVHIPDFLNFWVYAKGPYADDYPLPAPQNNYTTPLNMAARRDRRDIMQLLLDHGADINARDHVSGSVLIAALRSPNPDASLLQMLLDRGAAIDNGNDYGTPLMEAAGHPDWVKFLLDRGADVHWKSSGGITALWVAAGVSTESVLLLLDRGAEVNVRNKDGETALMRAARCGQTKSIQLLLERGAEVNARDKDGQTALSLACSSGPAETVQLLLDHGAQVNLSQKGGEGLLLYAKDRTIFQLLMDHGADLSVRNRNGWTALMSAVRYGDAGLVRRLLEKGVDVNAKDINGETALDLASAESVSHPDIVKLLVKHGAQVLDRAEDDTTALLGAIARGSVESVQYLLEHGANANTRNRLGAPALICAVGYNAKIAIVRLLLDHGADVNARCNLSMMREDPQGPIGERISPNFGRLNDTALMQAVAFNQEVALIRLLLDRGAQVNARDSQGCTALFRAVSTAKPNPQVLRLLLDRGAEIDARNNEGLTPLFPAASASASHPEVLRLLLERGADVHVRDRAGETVLIHAAPTLTTATLNLLTAKGADMQASTPDGETPLLGAAGAGNRDVMDVLLENGANVNARDALGNTALMRAVMAKDSVRNPSVPAIVRELLAQGIAVNASNRIGETALMWAVQAGNSDIVKLLLAHGADVNARDHSGRNAASFAPANSAISELLQSAVAHKQP